MIVSNQSLEKRPKCHMSNCDSEAYIAGWGVWLCGACFLKIKEREDKKKQEEFDKVLQEQ